ncbi:MAG: FMN-binding protein [Clostridia bacterium]|nr:FMN-binding protein [Clostridia bacterium]
MKQYVKLVLTLGIVAFGASLCLSVVNSFTEGKIAEHERQKTVAAMKILFPAVADTEFEEIESGIYKAGNAGYCATGTVNGYNGEISVMVGINTDASIVGIEVLEHSETAGFGAKAAEPEFKSRFVGARPELTVVRTPAEKDSEIQAITGATVTSKAVTKLVNDVYAVLKMKNLLGGGQ